MTSQLVRKALSALGTITVAVIIVAAISPRAVHGVVATLVQVTNTAANPASTLDADKSTRIPYQSSSSADAACGDVECELINFTVVPAGYRLVVQKVTGGVASSGPNHIGQFRIHHPTFVGLPVAYFSGTFDADGVLVFNADVKAYVDAGDGPAVTVAGSGIVPNGIPTMIVIGYLEKCSVTGCPAIQN